MCRVSSVMKKKLFKENIIYRFDYKRRKIIYLIVVVFRYYFWDDGNGLLAHKNVTMTLSWNIIPNAGNLPR